VLVGSCGPALAQVFTLAKILASRFHYAYDVNWMEGGALLHAARLLQGKPIYTDPSGAAGFLAFPYPPFLYAVLALVGRFTGLDYETGRLVSIVATSVTVLVLAWDVHRSFAPLRASFAPALLTVGAIAAGFPLTGGWYDVAMSDPLALALVTASASAVSVSSEDVGRGRTFLSGLLMTATIFTKQTYAAFVVWIVVFVARRRPRRAAELGALVAFLCLASFAIMQWRTSGHFAYYTVLQLLHHPIAAGRVRGGIVRVVRFAPYVALFVPAGAWLVRSSASTRGSSPKHESDAELRERSEAAEGGGGSGRVSERRGARPPFPSRALSDRSALWTGMFVTALVTGLVSYAKTAAYDNNLLPIVAFAPAAALCIGADLCRRARQEQQSAAAAVVAVLASVYLYVVRYDPARFTAEPSQKDAARILNLRIAHARGGVLFPSRPFLAVRNGSKIEQVHAMAWWDAVIAGRDDLSFAKALERQAPRFVLLTGQEPIALVEAMARSYVLEGRMLGDVRAARDLPGDERDIWILGRNLPDPPEARCLFEFEAPTYEGFAEEGNAFGSGPSRVVSRRDTRLERGSAVVGVVGQGYASSYSPGERDKATGVLVSPPFPIDRGALRFRIAGGDTSRTRVELRVHGEPLRQVSGRGVDYLQEVSWELDGEPGAQGELVLVDEDKGYFGHLLVDHVCLVPDEG
jgi:hypothetical protein